MKLHFLVILSVSLALCAPNLKVESLEITEDEHYIYTKKGWPDIAEDAQYQLISYFNQLLYRKMTKYHVPLRWSKEISTYLLGNPTQFKTVLATTTQQAQDYATSHHSIGVQDLIPVGIIMGLGISGNGNHIVGLGGAALITLILVPIEIEQFDKLAKTTTTHYEISWAFGGFGQAGIGIGEGGGVSARGAIGLIWGKLPSAASLNGVAIGTTANLGFIEGLGCKIALVFNSTTQAHNLVAMATFDMGLSVGGTVEGSLFYFMTAEQVLGFLSKSHIGQSTAGVYHIEQQNLKNLSF